MKRSKIWVIILGFIFTLPILYIIITDFYIENYIENNSVYRIAKIKKIDYVGKNGSNWIVFEYENKKGFEGRILTKYDSNDRIGKKYIVKMGELEWINKIFNTYYIYYDYPVPDSIKTAPPEGWKELPEWAKK